MRAGAGALLLADIEVQCERAVRDGVLCQQLLGELGLGDRAGEAVQHAAARPLGLEQPAGHQLDHELVGHEVATGERGRNQAADGRAGGDLVP